MLIAIALHVEKILPKEMTHWGMKLEDTGIDKSVIIVGR